MCEAVGKKPRAQGWEEAGSEFYQESYNSDWDGFLKETSAITTLLPSKQNRFGTCRRPQNVAPDCKTSKLRQPLASTTQRTQTHTEISFSALPDLSQVLTDEERIWEEMLLIKLMPVPMHQKKSLKANLQNTTKLRLQGFNQFKWKHRKAWQKVCLRWAEFISKLELWRSSLKQIEGHFGTGVVAYFLFLRWLFFLNCVVFLLIFLFLVLPNILMLPEANDTNQKCSVSQDTGISVCLDPEKTGKNNIFNLLDIAQGSGILQYSLMFYGAYSKEIIGASNKNADHNFPTSTKNETASSLLASIQDSMLYYNLPLAYIFVTVACFFVGLLSIVKGAAREFKDRLINGKWQFYQYCNLIFGGWDFCIHNEKSANIKHKAVYNEMKCILHSKRIEIERNNRSADFMYRIVLIRILVNIIVFTILMISAYFIFFLFNISLRHQNLLNMKSKFMSEPNFNSSDEEKTDSYNNSANTTMTLSSSFIDNLSSTEEQIIKFVFDFIPFIGIVGLNLLVPIIFNYLCTFEKYSPLFVVKISLFRTIFLRLASLGVLLSRFYYIIVSRQNNSPLHYTECWETFVGQQFYKLVITDFISHLLVTFCINLPRAVCARSLDHNFVRMIGEQEFDLPKHVLDIVYIQTICWLGSFYTPFLPAIVAVIIFFMFYLKKFQCLVNSKPSKIFYGASRSNSLFMFILLLSFFVALVPVTYAIAEIQPSLACGPFQGFLTVWHAPLSAFMKMPDVVKNFIFFFGTAGFAIPFFIILTLLLYYFYAVSDANKNMVEVLKNQLVLEGHDKQFLLTRLSLFMKQQQESHTHQSRNELSN